MANVTLKLDDEQIERGVQSMMSAMDEIILKRVKEFLERKKDGMPDSRDINDKTWRDRPPLL